jgi:hypothetical protein
MAEILRNSLNSSTNTFVQHGAIALPEFITDRPGHKFNTVPLHYQSLLLTALDTEIQHSAIALPEFITDSPGH